ncbi:MAG: hypothetical protein E7014_02490 [Alphaproteobacteria bacterium]|nr:hypothetical protein [Alphaproteobacteria bacterium]
MLNKFREYLISKGFKEFSASNRSSTVIDYAWRISKIIEQEGITVEQLSTNINKYIELYGKLGEKWSTGQRSHQSYINALKNFRKFILVSRFGGQNA